MNDIYNNDGIYKEEITYGSPYVSKGLKFSIWADALFPKTESVLCVGCGNGFDVVYWLDRGKNAFGTELHDIKCDYLNGKIIKAVAPGLPFGDKEFDLLLCTEVVEHIEPKTSKDFILDCCRVGKTCIFSIATTMDSYGTHINLKTPARWLEIFDEIKVELKNFQFKPSIHMLIEGYGGYSKSFVAMNYGDGIIAITKNGV